MTKEENTLSPLQLTLREACDGTSVSTRELLKELSSVDLAAIREGELTIDDLKEIVLDLALRYDDSNISLATILPEDDDPEDTDYSELA